MLGIEGSVSLDASGGEGNVSLTTAMPGGLALVLGAVIVVVVLAMQTEIQQGDFTVIADSAPLTQGGGSILTE